MPISAQEWRVRTGLNNSRKRMPVHPQMKAHNPPTSRGVKYNTIKQTESSLQEMWSIALVTILIPFLPIVYKVMASILEVLVTGRIPGGDLVTSSQDVSDLARIDMNWVNTVLSDLFPTEHLKWIIQATGLKAFLCVITISMAIVSFLILKTDKDTKIDSSFRVKVTISFSDQTQNDIRVGTIVASVLGMVSIATIILPLLLMLAGDVETNPGPETAGATGDSTDYIFAYQTIVECGEKIAHGLSQNPREMATALHEKGFISDDTLAEINELSATDQKKGTHLYSAILGKVKEYPNRYSDFIEILQSNEVLYGDLLEVINDTFSRKGASQPAESEQTLPLSIVKYSNHLRACYQEEPILQDDPWPPSIGKHYINLALIQHREKQHTSLQLQEDLLRGKIDQIQASKQPIDTSNVFDNNEGEQLHQFRILMDGAPGVGKTTLCRKICHDWAKGEILPDCQLLIYVPLRDSSFVKATKIEDLFYHDDPDLKSEVMICVRKTQGAGVTFIFDGYDELSKKKRERESLFLSIFKGKYLRQCSVLISSRPYASDRIPRMINLNRHIEILGFNVQQIESCIMEAITDETKAEGLVRQLENRQDLLSLCYIPINCATVIYVYTEDNYTIPATITELFNLFIQNTFQRQEDIHGTDRQTTEKYTKALSKIAFDSLKEDKLAFQKDEVPTEKEARLGLLTATKNFSNHGMEVTYQFIHLTVHEYLAAQWISSTFTEEQQAYFLRDHLSDDRFRMALIFLAGTTKLTGCFYQQVLSSHSLRLYEVMEGFDEEGHQHKDTFRLLIHLAYESQNHESCSAVANSIPEKILRYGMITNNVFQLTILGYFITQCGCTWECVSLTLHFDAEMFQFCTHLLVLQFQKAMPTTSIISLYITYFDTNKNYQSSPLLKLIWKLFQTTPLADIKCLRISQGCAIVGVWESEDLEHTNKTIIKNVQNVEHINLSNVGITSKIVSGSLIPLFKHCKNLKTLVIGRSLDETYQPMDAWTFCQTLKAIQVLELTKAEFHIWITNSRDVLDKVVRTYQSTYKLLMSKTTLKSLTLGAVFISNYGDDGMTRFCEKRIRENSILKALRVNTTLQYLEVDSYFLICHQPSELSAALCQNTGLISLNLTLDNEHSVLSIMKAIALGLKLNKTLKKLTLDIYAKGEKIDELNPYFLTDLVSNLIYHPSLESLVIESSRIRSFHDTYTNTLTQLFIRNSVISTVKISVDFSESQLMRIARGLVLNGRRSEIDLHLQRRKTDEILVIIVSEVNNFKNILFSSMIKLMAHTLSTRHQQQQDFLDYHYRLSVRKRRHPESLCVDA